MRIDPADAVFAALRAGFAVYIKCTDTGGIRTGPADGHLIVFRLNCKVFDLRQFIIDLKTEFTLRLVACRIRSRHHNVHAASQQNLLRQYRAYKQLGAGSIDFYLLGFQ